MRDTMVAQVRAFLRSEEGTAATEYAVMFSLILLVVVSGVLALGTKTNSTMNNAASLL